MDQGRVKDAPRNLPLTDGDILGIEEEDVELLVREVSQAGREDVVDVARPGDGVFAACARRSDALAKLDGRNDPGRHRGADPRDPDQPPRVHLREVAKVAAREVEHPFGEPPGRRGTVAGPDHERQKLVLRQGAGAETLQSLRGLALRRMHRG